ncbi:MAG: universal stress protein [Rhodospirillaceae bacterium]|nr:universal stress protein [Rhodospirillaceae bacterium]
MRKVLVPYDGSKPAFRALEYVQSRINRGEKLYVEILLVQPVIAPVDLVAMGAVSGWRDDERDAILCKPAFVTLVRKIDAKTTTQYGDPAERIVEFARKKHCREVVMGTRGVGRLKGIMLGSVATKVVQLINVPVTLVK